MLQVSALTDESEQHAASIYRVVDKYMRPRNTRTEMYVDRVACCVLVS